MSIVKLNNRSVKDITQFGSISSLGSLTHIATQTASSSASISFTSGIDSTYKEYIFYFVNIHASANAFISFQADRSGYSNYNTTATTTFFSAFHDEAGSYPSLTYRTSDDVAQGTGDIKIGFRTGSEDADMNIGGFLHLFNPSSTTFTKHFLTRFSSYDTGNYACDTFVGGYFNTTNALDKIRFKMSSGNIDSGQILLFGLN